MLYYYFTLLNKLYSQMSGIFLVNLKTPTLFMWVGLSKFLVFVLLSEFKDMTNEFFIYFCNGIQGSNIPI